MECQVLRKASHIKRERKSKLPIFVLRNKLGYIGKLLWWLSSASNLFAPHIKFAVLPVLPVLVNNIKKAPNTETDWICVLFCAWAVCAPLDAVCAVNSIWLLPFNIYAKNLMIRFDQKNFSLNKLFILNLIRVCLKTCSKFSEIFT